mgnify:FL=1
MTKKLGEASKSKPGKIITAALALIIIGASCIVATRPALAANIPAINKIVYVLSPVVEPSQEVQDKIAETIQGVLSEFISNATCNVGVRFK